jgi:hypothetical protein
MKWWWFLFCLAILAVQGSSATTCPSSGGTLTASSGSITDGYGYYSPYTSCLWTIAPSSGSSIRITFSEFDLERGPDYLEISDCDTVACSYPTNTVRLTGNDIPDDVIVGRVARVRFTTDGSVNRAGFTLYYSVSSASSSCSVGQYYSSSYSSCRSCTNKPSNAYYTSSGGSSSTGCSWSCSSGYVSAGGSSCSSGSCSVGEYYSSYYSSCQSCSNKPSNAYYTSSGGSSSTGCSWSCSSGYVSIGGDCEYYGSGYHSDLDEDVLLASNKASRIVAGVLGTVLLLTIVVVLIVMRARQLHSLPDPQFCACLHGYYPKMGCLIAAAVLALITLVLTLASESESRQCDYGHRIGLMSAALALHVIGGIVLYSLSDCGCRLCLCLCCRCDRPFQATTAIGFSLLFWFSGMGLYIWVILFLGIFDYEANHYNGYYNYYGSLEEICLFSIGAVPLGIGAWCGICSAAAMLLQGHFITLVPEAIAAMAPQPASGGTSGGTELVYAGEAGPSGTQSVPTAAAALNAPDKTNAMALVA